MFQSVNYRNSDAGDDTTYWYNHQNQHQQASLYPHNTYHGGTQVHRRAPLSQADFKPIRFTDLPETGYVDMRGKNGVSKPSDRLIPITKTNETFSAISDCKNPRRASNESNSEEEVKPSSVFFILIRLFPINVSNVIP